MLKYAIEVEQKSGKMASNYKENKRKSTFQGAEVCLGSSSEELNSVGVSRDQNQAQNFMLQETRAQEGLCKPGVIGRNAEDSPGKNLKLLHSSLKEVRGFLKSIETVDMHSSDLAVLLRLCKKLRSATYYKDIQQIVSLLEKYLEDKKLFKTIEKIILIAHAKAKILKKNFVDDKELLNKKIKQFKKTKLSESIPINLDLKKINELNADVRSKFYSRIDTFEDRSLLNFQSENFIFSNRNIRSEFYSLCLNIKFGIGTKNFSQTVPISLLYDKAKAFNLHPKDWFFFIHKELRNPSNWSKQKPCKRRSTLKNRDWENFVNKLT